MATTSWTRSTSTLAPWIWARFRNLLLGGLKSEVPFQQLNFLVVARISVSLFFVCLFFFPVFSELLRGCCNHGCWGLLPFRGGLGVFHKRVVAAVINGQSASFFWGVSKSRGIGPEYLLPILFVNSEGQDLSPKVSILGRGGRGAKGEGRGGGSLICAKRSQPGWGPGRGRGVGRPGERHADPDGGGGSAPA